jgi:hypothetical protein
MGCYDTGSDTDTGFRYFFGFSRKSIAEWIAIQIGEKLVMGGSDTGSDKNNRLPIFRFFLPNRPKSNADSLPTTFSDVSVRYRFRYRYRFSVLFRFFTEIDRRIDRDTKKKLVMGGSDTGSDKNNRLPIFRFFLPNRPKSNANSHPTTFSDVSVRYRFRYRYRFSVLFRLFTEIDRTIDRDTKNRKMRFVCHLPQGRQPLVHTAQ